MMTWLVILIIVSTIVGIVSAIVDDYDKIDGFLGGFFTVGVLGLCIIGILAVVAILNRTIIREYEEEQYKIQGLESNINTNQELNGAFVLGFGYVNSKSNDEVKYYYFKVNELGKKLESITIYNYSNTYIRETNEVEPSLLHKIIETKNEGFWKFLFGEDIWKEKQAEILVVPDKTIKIEYNVDI